MKNLNKKTKLLIFSLLTLLVMKVPSIANASLLDQLSVFGLNERYTGPDIVLTNELIAEKFPESFSVPNFDLKIFITKKSFNIHPVALEKFPKLIADDRARVSFIMDFTIEGLPTKRNGTIQGDAHIKYNPINGYFYLQDLDIKALDMNNMFGLMNELSVLKRNKPFFPDECGHKIKGLYSYGDFLGVIAQYFYGGMRVEEGQMNIQFPAL